VPPLAIDADKMNGHPQRRAADGNGDERGHDKEADGEAKDASKKRKPKVLNGLTPVAHAAGLATSEEGVGETKE
jgi:hypothetical protein